MKTHVDPTAGTPSDFGVIFGDAIGYWERRRIGYNIALAAVVVGWVVVAWARLRGQLDIEHVLMVFVLAALANVCYCAGYLVDVPMQYSAFRKTWQRKRWLLWVLGTLFGMALTWFWMADEILPVLSS